MPAQYPLQVEAHHKLTYAANVQLATQQTRNQIAEAATIKPASGEAMSVADFVGKVDYVRGEARSRRNTENPVGTSRRWVVYDAANEIKSGQYIDKEDKFKTATDPTSMFITAHTAAVVRGYQDQLLGIEKQNGVFRIERGGLYGIAREGKTPGNVGTPLPSEQYLSATSDALTVARIIEAVEKLNLADYGIDMAMDPLYGLISPKQKSDLLRIANASANGGKTPFDVAQLERGEPTMLMGVNWIMTNRIPVGRPGETGANKRLVAIWSKANLLGGEWEAINGKMWNDTSADDLPYARVRCNLDAVRAEDPAVVIIPCTE